MNDLAIKFAPLDSLCLEYLFVVYYFTAICIYITIYYYKFMSLIPSIIWGHLYITLLQIHTFIPTKTYVRLSICTCTIFFSSVNNLVEHNNYYIFWVFNLDICKTSDDNEYEIQGGSGACRRCPCSSQADSEGVVIYILGPHRPARFVGLTLQYILLYTSLSLSSLVSLILT